MKISLIIIVLSIFCSLAFCQEKVSVNTDYSPLNQAYDSVKQIQQRYANFKTIIYKNISMEYQKCKEVVQKMECRNVDQWQSVIEELNQENENSESAEIPFLSERKKAKVEKFAKVLNQSELENEAYANLTAQLSDHQQKIMDAFYLIEEMYKLPKQAADFVQLRSKQDGTADSNSTEEEPEQESESGQESEQTPSQLLNSDVPDLAKEQLSMAKEEYDIADQSIQAQTASNLLRTFNKKMSETITHVNQAYTSRANSLQFKKDLFQGDILKVRVMLQNEVNKQAANNERIGKLQEQIDGCKDMPTDELKDCNPIRVNASKLLTEIDIIQTRTDLLNKHLGTAVEDNLSADQVQQHLQNIIDAKSEKAKQEQIDSYLKDPEVQNIETKQPNELHPIHHLKDNLNDEEAKEEQATTEQPAEPETNETETPQ